MGPERPGLNTGIQVEWYPMYLYVGNREVSPKLQRTLVVQDPWPQDSWDSQPRGRHGHTVSILRPPTNEPSCVLTGDRMPTPGRIFPCFWPLTLKVPTPSTPRATFIAQYDSGKDTCPESQLPSPNTSAQPVSNVQTLSQGVVRTVSIGLCFLISSLSGPGTQGMPHAARFLDKSFLSQFLHDMGLRYVLGYGLADDSRGSEQSWSAQEHTM